VAIIKIYEHLRLPIIEFPMAIVVAEKDPEIERAIWESHVFLIQNGRLSRREAYSVRVLPDQQGHALPSDIESLLFDTAFPFAEGVVDRWQQQEYGRHQAMHLIQPVRLLESTERLLVRLWMGCIADDHIRYIREHTHSVSLRQLLDRIMLIPRVIRNDEVPYDHFA
jgi:hypothetical protein